ncbi:hypothetical protein Tco_1255891 [Tanacetum coccineum]
MYQDEEPMQQEPAFRRRSSERIKQLIFNKPPSPGPGLDLNDAISVEPETVKLLILYWKTYIEYGCSELRPEAYDEPLIPLPLPVAPQAVRDRYEVLYDAQNKVACLMLGSMSPDLQRALDNYKTYDMIQELKTMATWTLERLGYAMPKELSVGLILNSLNKDYDQFVQNYNMHSMGKAIAELHAMLKPHEKSIPKKTKTHAVLAIQEGKIQKDKKKLQRGLRGSRKLKHRALSLYMGNGMRATVKAIKSFDLVLRSGLIIVLDNCHTP